MAPLLAGAADPQAQSPSRAPAQSTVFRAEVDYVEVEAFVTDEAGKVVSGLSRDDFQVFEEGARQEIAVFAEIRIPIDRTDATPPERVRSTQDVATNEEGIGASPDGGYAAPRSGLDVSAGGRAPEAARSAARLACFAFLAALPSPSSSARVAASSFLFSGPTSG
jgi:hypothetical protein